MIIVILPVIFALIAAIAEMIVGRVHIGNLIFKRWLAVSVSVIGILCFGLALAEMHLAGFDKARDLLAPLFAFTSKDYFEIKEWGLLFCLTQSFIFLIGAIVCPKMPVVRVRMGRVYLIYSCIMCMCLAADINVFLLLSLVCNLLLMNSAKFHLNSFLDDSRRAIRVSAFTLYRHITSLGILLALLDHNLIAENGNIFTYIGLIGCTLASLSAIGLFPFHSWVVPFIGAPRVTIFLPVFVIQFGVLILFKLYAPVISIGNFLQQLGIALSVVGLMHAAISFFGEVRLKRIPAYLYLSHISLIMLGLSSSEQGGQIASALDSINLLIASCGLLVVCSLLTGRFGLKGVSQPTGLASAFPDLGICFLICALSLVGFPGTLGFIEEEFMLESSTQNHLFLLMLIITALTINGFSCFRLFARLFYGATPTDTDIELKLSVSERIAIWSVLLVLVVNGFLPEFLLKIIM